MLKLRNINERGAITMIQAAVVASLGIILIGAVVGFKQGARSIIDRDGCLIKLDGQSYYAGDEESVPIDLAEPNLELNQEDCNNL